MEGVIPNSRVVIMPPPGDDDLTWKRELFLRPGEWIPWVTLTVVIATVVLGAVVFALHVNEKVGRFLRCIQISLFTPPPQREDEAERRRALHSINFDAL
jgi:integrin alpha FG-GAP repeat containing protein 1